MSGHSAQSDQSRLPFSLSLSLSLFSKQKLTSLHYSVKISRSVLVISQNVPTQSVSGELI